jgi:hypothetical protein
LETYVVDGDNVGVVERGSGPGFLLEAAQMVGIVAGRGADELEGYITSQPFVARPKDFAHPSHADFFENPVMSRNLVRHRMLGAHVLLGMLGSVTHSVNTDKNAGDLSRKVSRSGCSPCYNL